MEWQPIKTAPKEPQDSCRYGPLIMLFADEPKFGFWDHDFGRFYYALHDFHDPQPTHWMPLPAPPDQRTNREA